MAEKERTVIFKLQLDEKQLVASGKNAETQLARIKKEMQVTELTLGKQSVEYQKLASEQQKYTKQLKESANALQINSELAGRDALTRTEQLRAQKALAVSYNSLTDAERESTDAGKAVTKQYLAINEALQASGLAVSDGRLSVGLYEKAIRNTLDEIKGLTKEQQLVSKAIGFTTMKAADAKKKLDQLGDSADTTTAEYKQLESELQNYNDTLSDQNQFLDAVNKDLKAQETQLEATTKAAEKIGFVYGNNEKNAESLKKQIQNVKRELADLAATEGIGSDAFIEATARAGELQDRLKDINEAVAASATGSKFEQLGNQVQGVTSDLLNLDLEGASEKLEAFAATASSVSLDELADGAGKAGKSILNLGKTLIASPLFLLTAAVGAIVFFWDDITKAINGTNHAQEGLNATLGDYKTGATDAGKKTLEVGAAFRNAEKGVISKKEALKIYNDTLGDTFGKATSLNEAENLYNSKTKAFVEASAKRAQAQALFALSAQASAEAMTAQFENNVSTLDGTLAGLDVLFGESEKGEKRIAESQRRGTAEARKEADKKAKILNEQAAALLLSAEQIEDKNEIVSESEKALNDELAQLAKERADKAKAAAEKAAEAEQKAIDLIRQLTLGNAELSAQQREQEIEAVTNFRRQVAGLEIENAKDLATKLLEIEQQRVSELAEVDKAAKEAKIATIESNLSEEIKALEGTAARRLEQEKLLREKADIELTALDVEFDQREIDRTASVEAAKQAIKDETLRTEEQRQADRISRMESNLQHEENLLREAGKTEEEIAAATAGRRIEIARAQNLIIQQDAEKSDAEKLASTVELETKLLAIKQEGVEADKALEEQKAANRKQIADGVVAAAEQLASTLFQMQQDDITAQINDLESAANKKQQVLADQLSAGVISQEKYNAEIKKIELTKQQEEAKLKKEAFEKQKDADLISAGISVSKAVLAGLTTQPFLPVGLAMGALAATLGAVQIAQIAGAETPAFAQSGKVLPTLSGQKITATDGFPIFRSNGDNLLASVKTNEAIINEKHINALGGPEALAAIGVPGFATGGSTGLGGQLAASQVENQILREGFILEAIRNSPPPVVAVEQIVTQTARVVSVQQGANIFQG